MLPIRLDLAVLCLFASLTQPGQAQKSYYGFTGDTTGVAFGYSVASAGDVNRDGHDDVIVGATQDSTKGAAAGAARVLSGLDGRTLYTFYGPSPSAIFGTSVSGAGDVNKDGYADVAVGAPSDSTGGFTGSVTVFSGKDGRIIRKITGIAAAELFGKSVACAQDVNRDGYPDLIVGAIGGRKYGVLTGAARVISGKDGKVLFLYDGGAAGDFFGQSVAGPGDVNGDGFADFAIGANGTDKNGVDSGSVVVASGKNGNVLYTFHGDSAGDAFGASVAGAGDVNRDGYPDLIAGAPWDDNKGTDSGTARVLSGKDGKVLYTLVGTAAGDYFGAAVSGAGDVDRDGFPDVLVGAPGKLTFSSRPIGFARAHSGRNGGVLFNLKGRSAGDRFGAAVASAGDVNRDTYADIIIGSPQDDTNSRDAGSARVWSGKLLELQSDLHRLPAASSSPQTQNLSIDVGSKDAQRLYWIFGSATGMHPGTNLPGVTIPLVADGYTSLAMGATNSAVLTRFWGRLDSSGKATARINVPANVPGLLNVSVFHACLVYDLNWNYLLATNAVPLHFHR